MSIGNNVKPGFRQLTDASLLPMSLMAAKIRLLQSVVPDAKGKNLIASQLSDADGNWLKTRAQLQMHFSKTTLERLDLAYRLAEWSDDNPAIVKALTRDKSIHSMRDVALKYNAEHLAAMMD